MSPSEAEVSLNNTSYTVSEDWEAVEVCVEVSGPIDCPVQYDFDVLLSTYDGTAGMLILIVPFGALQ